MRNCIPAVVCKVGTPELVEEDPLEKKRYAHWDTLSQDRALIPEKDSMTSCINFYRLTPIDRAPCIRFLLTAPASSCFREENYRDCVPQFEDTEESGS